MIGKRWITRRNGLDKGRRGLVGLFEVGEGARPEEASRNGVEFAQHFEGLVRLVTVEQEGGAREPDGFSGHPESRGPVEIFRGQVPIAVPSVQVGPANKNGGIARLRELPGEFGNPDFQVLVGPRPRLEQEHDQERDEEALRS